MLWYILKVIICSGILLGYYWLALRNKNFHQYNRFYLLAAIVVSLALPLLQINIGHTTDSGQKSNVIKVLQAVSAGDEYMDTVVISNTKQSWDVQQLLPFVYLLVSLVLLAMFIQSLVTLYLLIKKYRAQKLENIFFINTDNARGTPFSFFKYIFWNKAIDMHTTEGKQIFKHELAHIEEKHSYDKIFVNLLMIFFWCNPFFWLIRKELSAIHEFIADKKAVEDNDTATLAAMILQATYPQHRFQIANPFFYSSIKRRLLMLTKNKNPKVNYFGRLLVLPLAVIIFAVFSFKVKPNGNIYNGKKITVVIDAGHGGTDAGAKSSTGILEKDLTLALAKKVKALNTNNDIEIILTREEDVYISPKEKADFANNKKADLLISFHIDSDPALNQKSGMSFLVAKEQFPNTKESKVFARSLINEFSNNYSLPVLAGVVQKNQGIWILQASHAPAVLIDAGYINNATDLAYLQTDAGQETIAKNVLAAIEKYLIQPISSDDITDTVPDKLPTLKQWEKAAGQSLQKTTTVKGQPLTQTQKALEPITVQGQVLATNDLALEPITVTGYQLSETQKALKPITVKGQQVNLTPKLSTTSPIITLSKDAQNNVMQAGGLPPMLNLGGLTMINEGQYIIVDGKTPGPKFNGTIPGKYSIRFLDKKEAVQKYGNIAGKGAIELTSIK